MQAVYHTISCHDQLTKKFSHKTTYGSICSRIIRYALSRNYKYWQSGATNQIQWKYVHVSGPSALKNEKKKIDS
jgi:hypothetical protein